MNSWRAVNVEKLQLYLEIRTKNSKEKRYEKKTG